MGEHHSRREPSATEQALYQTCVGGKLTRLWKSSMRRMVFLSKGASSLHRRLYMTENASKSTKPLRSCGRSCGPSILEKQTDTARLQAHSHESEILLHMGTVVGWKVFPFLASARVFLISGIHLEPVL